MRESIGSKQELAELLGLKERRLTELIQAGIVPRRGPKGFDLLASARGYIAHLKAQPSTLRTERERVARLKGDLLEIELMRARKALVLVDDVVKSNFASTKTLKDRLYNIPDRCAGLLASEHCSQETAYQLLRGEITVALEELSDGYEIPNSVRSVV